jgi:hypothetical protein
MTLQTVNPLLSALLIPGGWRVTLSSSESMAAQPSSCPALCLLWRSSDEDGPITIHIQDQRPARTSNWLPAPASRPFTLTMRPYGAQAPILTGGCRLPAVATTNGQGSAL